jgi:hypothetical protein
MDGDGNGLFTDPQDRLWIDLNDDERWDSSSEQFLFASILTIGENRYAVRSDPFGQRLSVEPLTGSGTVRLALAKRQGLPAAVELTATLIGRDGSAVGLAGERAEASIPIGVSLSIQFDSGPLAGILRADSTFAVVAGP